MKPKLKGVDKNFIALCKKIHQNKPLNQKDLLLFIGMSIALFIQTKQALESFKKTNKK